VNPQDPVSPLARWGVLAILMASVVSKSTLSFISGGQSYGLKMTAALTLFVIAAGIGIAFT
jgi:hypothetical protein